MRREENKKTDYKKTDYRERKSFQGEKSKKEFSTQNRSGKGGAGENKKAVHSGNSAGKRQAEKENQYKEKQNKGKQYKENQNIGNQNKGYYDQKNPNQKNLDKENSGNKKPAKSRCPYFHKCGGCQYIDLPYVKQLSLKQKKMEELLGDFAKVEPIVGMKDPEHYRNKVHAVFGYSKKKGVISGTYQEGTHDIVQVDSCYLEDQKADEIIVYIRSLLKSFKIKTYDEDTGYGLFRHVMVRTGHKTGQIMVVLVTTSPVFPSKNNFVKALRTQFPEITTIVQNINEKRTSMVLGERNITMYGKGYIEDELCGKTYRLSPNSFYQINSVQTERLYAKAIEYAGLTGHETVIDSYCGIGTIALTAADHAKKVIGVELNKDAVKDAINNAKVNQVKNADFYQNDAGKFMVQLAAAGEKIDVVFMDPPRSGSTEEFMDAVFQLRPDRVVYVSCGPDTLARDLKYFKKGGYQVKAITPFDLFPFTGHVETVCLLSRKAPV